MRTVILLLTLAIISTVSAKVEMGTDTVCVVGTLNIVENKQITQHPWVAYDWVDTCTVKYAVVHDWNGRCGVYDLEKKENITELEFRDMTFTGCVNRNRGKSAAIFSVKRGHHKGNLIIEPEGETKLLLWPDADMAYSLDSCRTIDDKLTELSSSLLEQDLADHNGLNGQVLVIESQTGNVKTWVAKEKDASSNQYKNAPLKKKQLSSVPMKAIMAIIALAENNISWSDSVDTKHGIDSIGNVFVRDYNWPQGGFGKVTYLDGFKYHSDIAMLYAMKTNNKGSVGYDWWFVNDRPREMDALEIATIYNAIAFNGKAIVEPSVNTDSIKVSTTDGCPQMDFQIAAMCRQYLKSTLQDGGIGSAWTTHDVDISGDYIIHKNCRPSIYDDNIELLEKYHSEKELQTYNQVIFIGYFPSDNPRYTICVTMDKEDIPISGRYISNTVNKLSEYLNQENVNDEKE